MWFAGFSSTSNMETKQLARRVVMPGEKINALKNCADSSKIILGPGLRLEDEDICVAKSGILRFREPNVYWVDSHQTRVSQSISTILCLKFCFIEFKC